ncbi:MAG: UPF0149 family protein [Inhella sp.]
MSTQDLTDAEFDELDHLLEQTPGGLDPMDVAMLDGFLAGLLVQPRLIPLDEALPFIFDSENRPLPAEHDPAWLAKLRGLIERRLAQLRRDLVDVGAFDPIVLQLDEEALANEEEPALKALPAYSRALLPFAGGFATALGAFPNDLASFVEDEAHEAIARILRHLPPENDEERAINAEIDAALPLKSVDEAVEDLVLAVGELDALTEPYRYKVDVRKHEAPKVGRNDPCPCGSGKKFKACHGAT